MKKEDLLITKYSTPSKGMMLQMGYDLQKPVGLKNGARDFELIPYCTILDVKDSWDKTARMFGIGLPTRRGDDPIIVTIHKKQGPQKKRYICNAVISEEENNEMIELENEEEEATRVLVTTQAHPA